MKKKLISLIAVLALAAICATCLAACNPYKSASIGGGDPKEAAESNGGYAVKQGRYLYYINGHAEDGADSNWGKATMQNILRVELDENGDVKNETTKVVVPKIVLDASTDSGIAIFGEWIYYATANVDKDKKGAVSTTNTDFMRTKIDGSVTQRLGVIGTRSAKYIFTPTRVLYYNSNKISYFDFSKLQTKRSTDATGNSKTGEIASNVTSVMWKYGCDDIFFTQTVKGADSYKNYNNLMAVKYDGTGLRTLATEGTFLGEGETAVDTPQKVFKYTLQDMYVEADGSATLYYTKTYYKDSDTMMGLFCAKAANLVGTQKKLNTLGSTTLYPLGYDKGALAHNNAKEYCWYNGTNAENPLQVTTTSQTVWYVDAEKEVAYFTASSSAKALFQVSYTERKDNQTSIFEEGIKVDGIKLDFVGDHLYFIATDDKNYMHVVNVATFDKNEEDAKSTYIGFEREEEKDEDKE